MCDRSQFNRIRRNLVQVTNLIFTQLVKQFVDDVFIVDSFPLETDYKGLSKIRKRFSVSLKMKNNANKLFGNAGERNKIMFTLVVLFHRVCWQNRTNKKT